VPSVRVEWPRAFIAGPVSAIPDELNEEANDNQANNHGGQEILVLGSGHVRRLHLTTNGIGYEDDVV
jgi:hypothetical protein